MSPSARLLEAAGQTLAVRDGLGRQLVVRQLSALDRLRLFKAIGPALSQNNAYLGMAMLAASVSEIDSVPVPAPATEAQLESLVGRLGDAGIAAAAAALSEEAGQAGQDDDPGN